MYSAPQASSILDFVGPCTAWIFLINGAEALQSNFNAYDAVPDNSLSKSKASSRC